MAAKKPEQHAHGWREAGGIMLLAVCILVALGVASYHSHDISLLHSPPNDPPRNFIGPIGAWFCFALFMLLGVAGYLVPPMMGAYGVLLLVKKEGRLWPKAAWMGLLLLAACCLVELEPGLWEGLRQRLNVGNPGGLLGYLLGQLVLIQLLGQVGTAILLAALMVTSLVYLFEVQPVALFQRTVAGANIVSQFVQEKLRERQDERQQLEREEKVLAKRRKRLENALSKQVPAEPPAAPEPVAPPPEPASVDVMSEREPQPSLIRSRRPKKPAKPPASKPEPAAAPVAVEASEYQLPPISLLNTVPAARERVAVGDLRAGGELLKETLSEFGIDGEVVNVEQGPVVTRYEVLPAPGVRVERIANLSNNIALAMKAESVRVQAPIPGKGVVGIEVPNAKTSMVFIREILESPAWKKPGLALPLGIGKDVSGHEIVADLADMPHMLIAGATGAGKTVCMNSILAGLLMTRTPDQMKLMLVDPKIVEFSQYNKLPHLVVPVITDAKKVGHGLRWAIDEMESRYKLFAEVGVRNIKGYNGRPIVQQADLFEDGAEAEEKPKHPHRLPYIVIIVDELADLMLVAQAEIENHIARLAQLSRAVGIHMILATQRPSVNVITGTIKANFPARVAFKVSQKVDSRTILDANGADKLLGKGDMLFLSPGGHKLVRAQGAMTTDEEIHAIADFIRDQGEPSYISVIKEKLDNTKPDLPEMDDEDDLLETAVEVIRQTRRASTSSLQRRLRIGYTRAARLMDQLEEKGLVGPPRGSDPREILIDLDGDIPQNDSSATEVEEA